MLLQNPSPPCYSRYSERHGESPISPAGAKKRRYKETTKGGCMLDKTSSCTTNVPNMAIFVIKLLKNVSLELHVSGGINRDVPLHLNSKTIQLLAAIAWMRGAMIQRDVLIEAIWGQDRTDEKATSEKLRWLFESARKALRAATRKAVEQLNSEWGKVLLDPKIDIFECRNQMWRLSPCCMVIDLEAVEEQNRIIMEAQKRGELTNSVPDYVKDACESLKNILSTILNRGILRGSAGVELENCTRCMLCTPAIIASTLRSFLRSCPIVEMGSVSL